MGASPYPGSSRPSAHCRPSPSSGSVGIRSSSSRSFTRRRRRLPRFHCPLRLRCRRSRRAGHPTRASAGRSLRCPCRRLRRSARAGPNRVRFLPAIRSLQSPRRPARPGPTARSRRRLRSSRASSPRLRRCGSNRRPGPGRDKSPSRGPGLRPESQSRHRRPARPRRTRPAASVRRAGLLPVVKAAQRSRDRADNRRRGPSLQNLAVLSTASTGRICGSVLRPGAYPVDNCTWSLGFWR